MEEGAIIQKETLRLAPNQFLKSVVLSLHMSGESFKTPEHVVSIPEALHSSG